MTSGPSRTLEFDRVGNLRSGSWTTFLEIVLRCSYGDEVVVPAHCVFCIRLMPEPFRDACAPETSKRNRRSKMMVAAASSCFRGGFIVIAVALLSTTGKRLRLTCMLPCCLLAQVSSWSSPGRHFHAHNALDSIWRLPWC